MTSQQAIIRLLRRFSSIMIEITHLYLAQNTVSKSVSLFLFNHHAAAKQQRYQKLALTGFMKSFNLSFITIS